MSPAEKLKKAEPTTSIPTRVPKSFAAKALANQMSRSEALYEAAKAWMAAR
ncbi:hypothetical protein [Botrimarina mediterranea]|uniref:Uncharacterized protein n=1 Tax=Botrimarina mediterranea TaxID=2528022 RepID=A0A518K959_9BACT|nr:hypothetical protein [Botrimarina mediterranea]QDV74317.1 hypothetical protein Spa11_25190 [Botrimarina mediterranea]